MTPPSSSPDVAFFVPSLTVGGAQRVTVSVVNGLAERGCAVDLILSYPKGVFLQQVDDRVTVHSLNTPRIPFLGIGASVPGIRSYLREREPPVLFSAMTYASVVSTVAYLLSDVETKVVAVEHSTFSNRAGAKEQLTLQSASYLYGLLDHVVGVSSGVADSVIANTAVDESDVSVIYNPVPIPTIRAESHAPVDQPWLRSDDIETVLWAGRLEPEKDLPTLLEAFALLHRNRSNTRLVLAGTGSKKEEILELIEMLGIEEVVTLPGYIENPYPYMRLASVFVLSSQREGLPTVLIEALACGCPVVSTDCPSGPREILMDGAYGKLVPVADVRALSDAIRSTLDHPSKSSNNTKRAEDFSTGPVLDQYVTLIGQLRERD